MKYYPIFLDIREKKCVIGGGEEFVTILPETIAQQAMIVAGKIRTMVENLEIMHGEERLPVTISLGVSAACRGKGRTYSPGRCGPLYLET